MLSSLEFEGVEVVLWPVQNDGLARRSETLAEQVQAHLERHAEEMEKYPEAAAEDVRSPECRGRGQAGARREPQ